MQAIEAGVLDGNLLKCITKRKGELVTLQEAIADGIVLPAECKYRDFMTGELISIPEAVERGLISSVAQRSIFDIDGFKDLRSNDYVSFNVALSRDLLRRKSTGFALETGRDSLVPLEVAVSEDWCARRCTRCLAVALAFRMPVVRSLASLIWSITI